MKKVVPVIATWKETEPQPNNFDSDVELSESEAPIFAEDRFSPDEARTLPKWSAERVREEFAKEFQEVSEYLFGLGVNGAQVEGAYRHRFKSELENAKNFQAEEIEKFGNAVKELVKRFIKAEAPDTSNRNTDDLENEMRDQRFQDRPIGETFRSVLISITNANGNVDDRKHCVDTMKQCHSFISIRNYAQMAGFKLLRDKHLVFSANKYSLLNESIGCPGEVRKALLGTGASVDLKVQSFSYAALPGEIQFIDKADVTERRKYTIALVRCHKKVAETLFLAINVKPMVETLPAEEHFTDELRKDKYGTLVSLRNRFLWEFSGDVEKYVGDVHSEKEAVKREVERRKCEFLAKCGELLAPVTCVDIEADIDGINVYVSGNEADVQKQFEKLKSAGLCVPSYDPMKLRAKESKAVGNFCTEFNAQYEEIVPFRPCDKKGLYLFLIFRQANRELDPKVVTELRTKRSFFDCALKWTQRKNKRKGIKLRAMHLWSKRA